MLQQKSQAAVFDCFFTSGGVGKTGLTPTVDVYDESGTKIVNAASATEIGGGFYTYTLVGGSTGDAGNYRAIFKTTDGTVDQKQIPALWVIGATWVENVNATVSSRSSHSAADVWAVGTRTLTSFGTLVADISTAIWSAGSRTLTSYGTLVSDTATAVWGAASRTLTAFGFTVAPSANAVADAVWDEALAGHATAGSAGAALSAAGSAGDPWATELPGTYEPGQAGYIVGVNLDAQISALIGGPYAVPSFEGACANVQYFDAGEIKPVADRLVATNGTFTISAATVTLRNGDGDVVYGINGLNATGFDIGALVSPRAWYVLNTANPPSGGPIAAGTYELEFSIVGTASDGEDRTLILAVTIVVS